MNHDVQMNGDLGSQKSISFFKDVVLPTCIYMIFHTALCYGPGYIYKRIAPPVVGQTKYTQQMRVDGMSHVVTLESITDDYGAKAYLIEAHDANSMVSGTLYRRGPDFRLGDEPVRLCAAGRDPSCELVADTSQERAIVRTLTRYATNVLLDFGEERFKVYEDLASHMGEQKEDD